MFPMILQWGAGLLTSLPKLTGRLAAAAAIAAGEKEGKQRVLFPVYLHVTREEFDIIAARMMNDNDIRRAVNRADAVIEAGMKPAV